MQHRAGTTAQRIRIGLTGLAFAFLLVLLGSIVSRSGQEPGPPPTAEENLAAGEPKEPLAQLGVAPGSTPADNTSNSTSSAQ